MNQYANHRFYTFVTGMYNYCKGLGRKMSLPL